jgi:hypothetical protein
VWSAETVFVCALALLGRTEQSFPPVQFVENVPEGVSPLAAGYVPDTEARIVVITSTSAFMKARGAIDRCGQLEALREIAGVLAHEEWHVRHGPDERRAYEAQLTALLYAGADWNSPLFHKVTRAKQAVGRASKRVADARAAEERRLALQRPPGL